GRVGGTDPAVLANDQIMKRMIPAIRADAAVTERYVFRNEPRLACPIVAYHGADDALVSHREAAAWGEHTTTAFRCEVVAGDHFFIRDGAIGLPARVAHLLAALRPR